MSAIAGRVLILPKGDYDASVTYEFLDLVNHNSSSWLAKKASQGVEPSDANTEYWQKFGSSFTVDGETITIDENGVISAVGGTAEKVEYENESVADVTNVKEALDAIFEGGAIGEDYATKTEVGYPSYTTQTVNLLPPPTYTSVSDDGVTCTYNEDGSLTFNGETTQWAGNFPIYPTNSIILKKGKYKIMLNPSADSPILFSIGGNDNTSGLEKTEIHDSAIIDVPETGTVGSFGFFVPINTTIDNVIIKPMLTTNLEATYDDFVPYDATVSNAGYHNSVYRGKYLGDHVTDEQYEAISSGTFDDLFIGDYWIINGVTYRIAAFDYYLNTGDTPFLLHHVVVVIDTVLYNHVMNDTATTTGGYVGSKMYTEGLEQAKTIISEAFGTSHVLSHRQLLSNAVTNGYSSGHAWYDSTVELMTEQNVYGGRFFSNISNGTNLPNNQTIDKSQIPLFAFRPDMISNRTTYFLRDVVSSSHFAVVYNNGASSHDVANLNNGGVRPYFCIG